MFAKRDVRWDSAVYKTLANSREAESASRHGLVTAA
jgi:hypothetical protein